ncbi:MAG: hypothetical protein ACKO0W_02915 [Planctomycetota bacterium]
MSGGAAVPAMLAVIRDGRWYPGIGDPTVAGWLTVAVYAAAACCCALVVRRARMHGAPRAERRFWICCTAGMVLLGINKQLDLQGLVVQIAREIAQEGGWYDDRAPVQRVAILSAATLGVVGTCTAGWLLRRSLPAIWPALVGIAMLAIFISARLTSWHRIDVLLSEGVVKLKWVLEAGGAGLVGIAAAWRAFRLKQFGSPPPRRVELVDPASHAARHFLRRD